MWKKKAEIPYTQSFKFFVRCRRTYVLNMKIILKIFYEFFCLINSSFSTLMMSNKHKSESLRRTLIYEELYSFTHLFVSTSLFVCRSVTLCLSLSFFLSLFFLIFSLFLSLTVQIYSSTSFLSLSFSTNVCTYIVLCIFVNTFRIIFVWFSF